MWVAEHLLFGLALFWNLPAPRSDTGDPLPNPTRILVISSVLFLASRAAAMSRRRETAAGAIAKTLIFMAFSFTLQLALRFGL